MTEQQKRMTGTLMRGADGTLYFIPSDDLAQLRVPDGEKERVEEALRLGGDTNHKFLEAGIRHIAGVEVYGEEVSMCVGRESARE